MLTRGGGSGGGRGQKSRKFADVLNGWSLLYSFTKESLFSKNMSYFRWLITNLAQVISTD